MKDIKGQPAPGDIICNFYGRKFWTSPDNCLGWPQTAIDPEAVENPQVAVVTPAKPQPTHHRPSPPSASMQEESFRDFVSGKIWKLGCKGGDNGANFATKKYIMTRGDGTFGYNYRHPRNFTFDGTDHWGIAEGRLIFSISDGHAIDHFDISFSDQLIGRPKKGPRMRMCPTITLTRVK